MVRRKCALGERGLVSDALHPPHKRLRREHLMNAAVRCHSGVGEGAGGNAERNDASSLQSHCNSSSSSSSSSSTISSSSASSRSLSPVRTAGLSLPVSIVRPMQSGNNGQVFLAHTTPHEEREAAHGQGKERSNTREGLFSGGAGDYIAKGIHLPSEHLYMAVKFMRASSGHAQREVQCLKHLDHKFVRERSVSVKTDDGRSGCSSQLLCLSSIPSPLLFFTKEVQGYVAIGIELLGPDLFDFTERYILHEDELCFIGIEIIRTLQNIHQQGIIHRSVKPENFCFNAHNRSVPSSGATGLEYTSGGSVTFPPFDEPSALMFKIIDYGRSTIIDETSAPTSYERPFTGWWHSLRGFLGKPMGQKDDLMGAVHSIGYLLDDYSRDGSCSGSYSEGEEECEEQKNRYLSSDSTERVDAARGSRETELQSTTAEQGESFRQGTQRHTYSSCRRVLADKIYDAYRTAARLYRLEGPRETIPLETHTQQAERIHARREWIVRRVERDFLKALLPDKYYPRSMPQWWVEWFANCSAWCDEDAVSAHTMANAMVEGLQRRMGAIGSSVEDTRRSVLECLRRYQRDRDIGEEERNRTMAHMHGHAKD